MDSRVISGNTFGSHATIFLGDFTSPEPLPTVNNAAHADGPRRALLYHQESPIRNVEIQQDPTRKAREIEILRRLYKSPYEDQKNRNPDRTRGTCEWFVAHKLFQEWQESKQSTTFWVSADPGCGKSVLVKHLIDSVLLSTASRTTCYFFFKDDFEDQKNIVNALCCILYQLFRQKRVLLSEAILEQFEIYGEEVTDSFGKLWNTLLNVAEDGNAGEIVCLLDAIDECEDYGRSQLARALQTLYNTGRSSNLKFLLTSRPYVSIRHGFRPPDIPELAVVHLSGESDDEIIKISQEIDTFIQARVRVIGKKLKLRGDEQGILLRELMRVPNRTYLWVHLTLDLIEQDLDLDKHGIVRITSHLPNTVEEAYERILSRSRNFEEAKKLLHIVVSAARPLTLNEMNLALTLRSHHQSYGDLNLKSEERFRENVRDLCGLFIAVINSRIYLLHQTAKEFLVQNKPSNVSKRNQINLKWKHSLWPQESHRILAEICIWHLLFAEFEAQSPDGKGMISQFTDNHVFLDYSAKHWTTHVRESRIDVKNSLSQSILKLCDGTSNRCLTWLRICWRSTNTDFPQNFTALMIASYFGLTTVMKLLLILDSTVLNSRDDTYKRSALSWAAGNGYRVAVKLLIEGIRSHWKGLEIIFKVGAQVDSVDRHDLTPLSYAVLNGHVAVAELLLEAGARVDTRDSIGGTPLSYAVCNGHEHMVNLLFKRGINIDLEEDMSVALLLSAAEKGHEGIIKLLLDKGRVDPNSKDKDGNTPLYLAVKNGHKPIIELLLEKPGDKVTITKEVVQAAAGNSGNGKEVMALLLKQQRDHITITEEAVITIAAKFDKEVMTLLLDRRGDQITITEEAVITIAARFNKEVMTLLLDRRGDEITITEEVIKAAAGNFWNSKQVITLLLNRRGDEITITEEVIKAAAGNSWNGKEVITLLLDQRGDQITITEEVFKAAAGNSWNGKEVMTLLLDRRGDKITITEEVVEAISVPHTRYDYTIGWVCALPKELTAAIYMLDERHSDLKQPRGDSNAYFLGKIGEHNVVITGLPKGVTGNTTTVAARMISSFPNVKVGLMVGIGSGIPQKVRLGDVVISAPVEGSPGVIQWDMGRAEDVGRAEDKGFVQTGSLNPPAKLLSALAKFQAEQIKVHATAMECLGKKVPEDYYQSPQPMDIAYKSSYLHLGGSDCSQCDDNLAMKRELRQRHGLHYGLIASGNQVIKSAKQRNKLYRQFNENILCIETEAAGLINDFPCIVIRGISDYGDSHINIAWQDYAATAAAAYAKTFLNVIPASEVNKLEAVKSLIPPGMIERTADSWLSYWFSKP